MEKLRFEAFENRMHVEMLGERKCNKRKDTILLGFVHF
jgi:hypothetical protein